MKVFSKKSMEVFQRISLKILENKFFGGISERILYEPYHFFKKLLNVLLDSPVEDSPKKILDNFWQKSEEDFAERILGSTFLKESMQHLHGSNP